MPPTSNSIFTNFRNSISDLWKDKEQNQKANSIFSDFQNSIPDLWKDKKQKQKTSSIFSDFRTSISDSWNDKRQKGKAGKDDGFQFIRVEKQRTNKTSNIFRMNYGRGGALGIGCGAGIGAGVIGGIGMGASPWNHLQFVLGVGAGCGVGVGYGFGLGYGLLWDRPPPKHPSDDKRIVLVV